MNEAYFAEDIEQREFVTPFAHYNQPELLNVSMI